MIQISSKREGFRRCGVAHPRGPVTYDDGEFSAEEIEILQAEPMLTVVEIDGGDIAKSPGFDQMTVKELKELCARIEISIPARANKADLIELLNSNTAEAPEA